MSLVVCNGCGAAPGEFHEHGCDVERCPRCGGQMISCGCVGRRGDSRRVKWTGEWPGAAECREFGFWAVFGPEMAPPQRGWVSVPAGTPGATEDLNRLTIECTWDPEQQRYVRRQT